MAYGDNLPSIEWKQPCAAKTTYSHPIGRHVSVAVLLLWVFVVRGFIHLQLNKTPDLLGYGMEVITDPIVWGLWFVSVWMHGSTTEESVEVGEYDCPHCGKRLQAKEATLNAPLGRVLRCGICDNSFVKRSAPPRL